MGQYWKPVNLTKREFIEPHKLGSGLKLCEQVGSGMGGVGSALIVLLASMPERRGGGDLQPNQFIGRWAGDCVVIVGDYADDADMPNSPVPIGAAYGATLGDVTDDDGNVLVRAFTDITADVREILETELGGQYVGDPNGWMQLQFEKDPEVNE